MASTTVTIRTGPNPACDPTGEGEPFVACDAAKRRLAILAALHLTAPGLPVIEASTLFLRENSYGTRTEGLESNSLDDWSNYEPGMWKLFRELIHLRRDVQDLPKNQQQGLEKGEDVPGTTGGLIGSGFATQHPGCTGDEICDLLGWHRWDVGGPQHIKPGDDAFVIANVSGTSQTGTFTFPAAGEWKVRLKTNDPRYEYVPEDSQDPEDLEDTQLRAGVVFVPSDLNVELRLPQYTAVVLSQDCADIDGDGMCDYNADSDDDGIFDYKDNCVEVPTRFVYDADGDGYGNACDPDLDNNGWVGISVYNILSQRWGSTDALADLDGNGVVDMPDWEIFLSHWGGQPGPSGLACKGSGELCTGPGEE